MSVDSLELTMPEVDWGWDVLADAEERLAALKKEGKRCVPVRHKGELAWLVLDSVDIDRCFRDGDLAYNFNRTYMDVQGFTLFNAPGEVHKSYKTAIMNLLSPKIAQEKALTLFAPVADQLIDEFGDAREVEFWKSFSSHYTWTIQTKLLGLPVDRENADEIRSIVSDLTQINDTANYSWDQLREKATTAKARFGELFMPVVKERRKNPGDDVLSAVFNIETEGRKLNDDEVLSTFGMLYDGVIGTSYQIPNVVYGMLTNPEIKDVMLNNPDKRAAGIEELLRMFPVIGQGYRRTVKDMEIGGVMVPGDSIILLATPAVNRDPSYFNNPNQFSLEKRRPSFAFGAGVRMCPGRHFARQELKVAIDRLLDRLPGLRYFGKPLRFIGTLGRYLEEDMRIAFDGILPADQVPQRNY